MENEKPRKILYEGTIGGDYEIIYEPLEGHCPRCNAVFPMAEDGSFLPCTNCGLVPQTDSRKEGK
jgi:ribosomal protein S27AE